MKSWISSPVVAGKRSNESFSVRDLRGQDAAGVLFVLLALPIPIEKADRHTVLADCDSTGQIAVLPEDFAGIVGGQ